MLLLCLILAHLVADFYLQTDNMVKEKLKHIKKHMTHHFLTTLIILISFLFVHSKPMNIMNHVVYPLLFIISFHFLLDLMKISLLDKLNRNNEENLLRCSFFLLDQLLHIVTILLAAHLFFGTNLTRVLEVFQQGKELSPINAVLFVIIIIILATSVSGHIIRILLGTLPNQLVTFEGKYSFKTDRQEAHFAHPSMGKNGLTEEYNYTIFSKHDLSRGKLIGYIERLLVLVLAFYSAYPAIGFIVAAKSIARFKQMDDRNWAEYFLLGTLTSMFIGISLGIVLREVLL